MGLRIWFRQQKRLAPQILNATFLIIIVVFVMSGISLAQRRKPAAPATAQKGSTAKKSAPQSKKTTTTLEQIVAPFALPAGSPDKEPDWKSADEAVGVRWEDKAPFNNHSVEYIRNGTTNLLRHGKAHVWFAGSKTTFSGINIMMNGAGEIFEWDEYSKVLHAQFGPKTTIRLLRGKCKEEDSFAHYSALYEVTLDAKKPIYVWLETDESGNHPGFWTSTFGFFFQLKEDDLKCDPAD